MRIEKRLQSEDYIVIPETPEEKEIGDKRGLFYVESVKGFPFANEFTAESFMKGVIHQMVNSKSSNAVEFSMNFSKALEFLKEECKVSRSGWNGKGMYVVLQKGYLDGIPINKNTAEATGIPEGTMIKFLPYLMMKTVDDSFVPWLASQTDLLADDWGII